MSEQAICSSELAVNMNSAAIVLEKARSAHERYLVKFHEQDLQEAMENYITAIKLNPAAAEAYYRLASLMWENGQIEIQTAIEQCLTAINLAPKNVNAYIYAGYFFKKANDFEKAENSFKNAIKLGGLNSSRPRLILALTILEKMNAGKFSCKDFSRSLFYLLTGSLTFARDFAFLKMLYKNFSEALSIMFYKSTGELFESINSKLALNIYKKAIAKTEHGEIFNDKIGDIYIRKNLPEEALEYYKNSYASKPNSRELVIKLATVCQTYFPENVDETIDYYNKLLELEEPTAQVYYELGHLYLKKHDKIHAISAFKLALEKDKENPFYNNALAYAFAQAELYDDAIEYYQKAIKINPDAQWTAIVCQALGSIYFQMKENSEAAIASYQAGTVLDPENSELFISLGDVYMADGDLDNAIRAYCDSINIVNDDYKAYAKLGLALWEKDFLDEAIVAYHKAIDLNPDYDIAQNNLGVIYLDGLGEPQESLQYFETAIENNSNYTLAYYNAGRACQILGKANKAANYYQTALDLNKFSNELDEAEIKERIYGLFNT